MVENKISGAIVDAAYRTHKALGPGLLESIYEQVLAYELEKLKLTVQRQHPISISYEDHQLGTALKADLLVQEQVIVEIKSVECLTALHRAQLLTYLRLANKPLGLLINFNTVLLKDGVKRVVNQLAEPAKT